MSHGVYKDPSLSHHLPPRVNVIRVILLEAFFTWVFRESAQNIPAIPFFNGLKDDYNRHDYGLFGPLSFGVCLRRALSGSLFELIVSPAAFFKHLQTCNTPFEPFHHCLAYSESRAIHSCFSLIYRFAHCAAIH